MIYVDIKGDINKALQIEKQLRFAAASTLTKVAGRSQDRAGIELLKNFHVRRPWWKPSARFGVKFRPATKQNLTAVVYTGADWLLEAEGHAAGVKVPDKHKGHLAVPDVQETRHGINQVVRKTEKARYLLANAARTRAFKVTTKSGYTLILQRKGGRGGRGGKNARIVTKYIFRKSVKVPQHSVVIEPTIQTVIRYFPSIFGQELRNAFHSARTP